MSESPQVPPEQFVESMREEVEEYLKQIMDAVNHAPDGAWISGSEEQVRDIRRTRENDLPLISQFRV